MWWVDAKIGDLIESSGNTGFLYKLREYVADSTWIVDTVSRETFADCGASFAVDVSQGHISPFVPIIPLWAPSGSGPCRKCGANSNLNIASVCYTCFEPPKKGSR